ncbi:tape measure protein [Tistrella mobilis]|uniref:tape measure protein n=1 Tax=Tistrella mobilis TaxID=171437 RepID=UPI0035588605
MTDISLRLVLQAPGAGAAADMKMAGTATTTATTQDKATETTARALNDARQTVAGAVDTVTSVAGRLLGLADAWAGVEARIAGVAGASAAVVPLQQEIARAAQDSQTSLGAMAGIFTGLARDMDRFGGGLDRAVGVSQAIAQGMALSGAAGRDLEAAATRLAGSLARAAVDGRSFTDAMTESPRLAEMLAQGLGTSTDNMMALAREGRLASADVFAALENRAPAIADAFEALPPRIGGALSALDTSFTTLVGRIDQTFGITERMAAIMLVAADNIGPLVVAGGTLAAMLGGIETGITVARTAFMALNATLLFTPLGAITTAVVLAGAALVAFADDIHPVTDSMVTLADLADVVWDQMKLFAGDIWTNITGAMGKAFAWIGRTIGSFGDTMKSVYNTTIGLFAAIGGAAIEVGNTIYHAVIERFNKSIDAVGNVWDRLMDGDFKGAAQAIGKAYEDGAENAFGFDGLGERLQKTIHTALTTDYIGGMRDAIATQLTDLASDLGEMVTPTLDAMVLAAEKKKERKKKEAEARLRASETVPPGQPPATAQVVTGGGGTSIATIATQPVATAMPCQCDRAVERTTVVDKTDQPTTTPQTPERTKPDDGFWPEISKHFETAFQDAVDKLISGDFGGLKQTGRTLLKDVGSEITKGLKSRVLDPLVKDLGGTLQGLAGNLLRSFSGLFTRGGSAVTTVAGSDGSLLGGLWSVLSKANGSLNLGNLGTQTFGSLAGPIDKFGWGLGLAADPAASVSGLPGLMAADDWMLAGANITPVQGGWTATSLGSALGAAGIGFTLGGPLAGLFGGNQLGGSIGGGLGAAGGAILAGVPGIAGTGIATALGGLALPGIGLLAGAALGGLIGNKKPSNYAAWGWVSPGTGERGTSGYTRDPRNVEARDTLMDAIDQLGAMLEETTGGSLDHVRRFIDVGGRDGIQYGTSHATKVRIADLDDPEKALGYIARDLVSELTGEIPEALTRAVDKIDWSDVDKAMQDITFASTLTDTLKWLNQGLDLNDNAARRAREAAEAQIDQLETFRETAERLNQDMEPVNEALTGFVERLLGIRDQAPAVTEFSQAMITVEETFATYAKSAADFGLTAAQVADALAAAREKIANDYSEGLDRRIRSARGLGVVDQVADMITAAETAARDAFTAAGSAGVAKLSEALGLEIRNMVDGAGLSAEAIDALAARFPDLAEMIRRVAVDTDTAAGGIRDWLAALDQSEAGGGNATSRFQAAQSAFAADLAAARTGDAAALGRITASADTLLGLGREINGSGVRQAALVDMVRSSLAGLPALTDTGSDEAALAEAIAALNQLLQGSVGGAVTAASGSTGGSGTAEAATPAATAAPAASAGATAGGAVAAQAAETARSDALIGEVRALREVLTALRDDTQAVGRQVAFGAEGTVGAIVTQTEELRELRRLEERGLLLQKMRVA